MVGLEEKKVRIGILGAGFMGKTHAQAFAKIPDVEIAAVVSRRIARAAEVASMFGARALTDPGVVLADESIDAIDVTYPTALHREYVIAGLEHGKHVFCEKPIALTLEDADAMIMAARRSSRVFQVAHVLRFWPEYRLIHDLIATGEVGRPLCGFASRLSFRPNWAEWIRDPNQSGGQVIDLMIHDFDYLNWLFGLPKWVSAIGFVGPSGVQDHVFASLAYDGTCSLVEGSAMMPDSFPFSSMVRITCEKGVLEYSFRAAGPSVEMGQKTNVLTYFPYEGEAQQLETPQVNPYEAECAYFVDCMRGKIDSTSAPLTPEQARAALAVALAARESLYSGAPATLAPSVTTS
jgi:UDP-N-acetylglucosamine 3-dehydrogenase